MAAAPRPTTPPVDLAPAWWQAPWLIWVLKIADPLSLAALFAFWLSKSWLRWGDPLIDFPRALYAAWRMSEGDLLYRDVVGQYDPLAYLIQAAGCKIWGVGLNTMVWMNVVVAIAAILLLRAIFRALGSQFMGWLASVVFVCVFAFDDYYLVSNYNFITPYSAQATYGFVGLLLVLWGLLRYLISERAGWLVVAGLGLAVAYLDKPDIFLAASGALLAFLSAWIIRCARVSGARRCLCRLGRTLAMLAAGFALLWLPVFLFFLIQGGLAYAISAADHEIHTLTNPRMFSNVENSPLMAQFFGFDDPWGNFIEQMNAGIVLVLGCLLTVWAARQWARARAGSPAWGALLLLAFVPVLAAVTRLSDYPFWTNVGEAFAFPVYLATAGYLLWSWRMAWGGQEEFKRFLGLAVLGVAASLMLVRMILNVRLEHFGFFMMPLAVCFWIHLMVVESGRPAPPCIRANWLAPAAFSAVVLMGVVQLSGYSLDQYAQKTYAVGAGSDRFYTYPPNIYPSGWLLQTMMEGGKLAAPDAKLLAVLPEGVAVNYHLRKRSPFAYLEVFPIAITPAAAQRALDALKAQPPDLVMLYARDLSENGAYYFGSSKASGRDVMVWLRDHYKVAGYAGVSRYSITRHGVDFLLPNSAPLPPEQVVPVDLQ